MGTPPQIIATAASGACHKPSSGSPPQASTSTAAAMMPVAPVATPHAEAARIPVTPPTPASQISQVEPSTMRPPQTVSPASRHSLGHTSELGGTLASAHRHTSDFGGTLGFGSSVSKAAATTPPLSLLPEFKGRPQLQQNNGFDYFHGKHNELENGNVPSAAKKSRSMSSALDVGRNDFSTSFNFSQP